MGATLLERDWNGAAARQWSVEAYANKAAAGNKDELFKRRLAEAQAFGAASERLSSQHPEFSARWGASAKQRVTGFALFIGFAVWLYFSAASAINTLAIAIAIVFAFIIAMRLVAVFAMFGRKPPPAAPMLRADELPVITVLVPLYREAAVVPNLIAAISQLDYPSWRLDVKLLVEADDPETIAAIEAQFLPSFFEVIPIPPGAPRTKPKALNYALAFARGDIIAIFDAEDVPAPGQLRAAMAAFQRGPRNLAVVQAPLQIHNGQDSWVARQFALEYAIHFRVWLPLLARLKLPVPLGGTSNYFRRDALRQVGGWDAWNVTEDADIGMRLARFGYVAGMVTPPTLEEAPTRFEAWRRQRSRWMKGHLQTWLVLNRYPFRAMREMGALNYLSTHLTLGGGILAAFLHGPLYLWIAANVFVFRDIQAWHWVMFGAGYASAVLAALASRSRHVTPWMLASMLVYWPLQSWAMLRALVEMQLKPHFWAKTQHGVTASRPIAGVRQIRPEPPVEDGVQLHFEFF